MNRKFVYFNSIKLDAARVAIFWLHCSQNYMFENIFSKNNSVHSGTIKRYCEFYSTNIKCFNSNRERSCCKNITISNNKQIN